MLVVAKKPSCLGFGLKAGDVVLLQELIWVNFFGTYPGKSLLLLWVARLQWLALQCCIGAEQSPFAGLSPYNSKGSCGYWLLFKITLSLS